MNILLTGFDSNGASYPEPKPIWIEPYALALFLKCWKRDHPTIVRVIIDIAL